MTTRRGSVSNETLSLVSPFVIWTSATGTTFGFAELDLDFPDRFVLSASLPEPGEGMLLATGIVVLLVLGIRRRG